MHTQTGTLFLRIIILILIAQSVLFYCSEKAPSGQSSFVHLTLDDQHRTTHKLPKKLKELSGLAVSSDGRLFGHNDERADIYQIDEKNGDIVKSFSLGNKTVKKDFEGLAIAGDTFYLVTSSGTLYEFSEGNDNSEVAYEKYTTSLSAENDVEGLCYDSDTHALLLACKADPGKGYTGSRAVYSFSLKEKKLNKNPRFLIPIKAIKNKNSGFAEKVSDFFLLSEETFAPSGIEKHPQTGTFFVLAAKGRLILEIAADGNLLGLTQLDKKHHPQPEGITFTCDNHLIIGDEGGNGKAAITIYPPLKEVGSRR
jgi:uncharacterized protein YjiK